MCRWETFSLLILTQCYIKYSCYFNATIVIKSYLHQYHICLRQTAHNHHYVDANENDDTANNKVDTFREKINDIENNAALRLRLIMTENNTALWQFTLFRCYYYNKTTSYLHQQHDYALQIICANHEDANDNMLFNNSNYKVDAFIENSNDNENKKCDEWHIFLFASCSRTQLTATSMRRTGSYFFMTQFFLFTSFFLLAF